MIEMKFYRDDEYVYINNPDGTTKRVPIEDFESAISGGELTLDSIIFNANKGQLLENGVALNYKDFTSKFNNGLVPVVKWSSGNYKRYAYFVGTYTASTNREVRFITVNDNGVVSIMLFTAKNNTDPLTILD